jgi:hypothetical protein
MSIAHVRKEFQATMKYGRCRTALNRVYVFACPCCMFTSHRYYMSAKLNYTRDSNLSNP